MYEPTMPERRISGPVVRGGDHAPYPILSPTGKYRNTLSKITTKSLYENDNRASSFFIWSAIGVPFYRVAAVLTIPRGRY